MIFYLFCCILLILLYKVTIGWCHNKVCLVGKTAIITGGNSGIGYQIALSLASRGCKVIIADKEDGSKSKHKIVEETDNRNIFTSQMDLGSFESVRKFAEYIKLSEPKIDILINNAGIGSTALKFTEDGLQRTMQVNYLGHFLLTYLLLELLKKSAPSRVIFTSSSGAYFTKLKTKDLNPREDEPRPYKIYLNSKLCLLIAAKYFAEKLKGSCITFNCFHPGAVRSGIFMKAVKDEWSLLPIILGLISIPFGKSPEEGAQTAIYLATEKEIENITGGFFVECRQFIQPLQAYNKEFCREIFEYTKHIVKLKPEEITI